MVVRKAFHQEVPAPPGTVGKNHLAGLVPPVFFVDACGHEVLPWPWVNGPAGGPVRSGHSGDRR